MGISLLACCSCYSVTQLCPTYWDSTWTAARQASLSFTISWSLTSSFPNLEPICLSLFDSNCCFLTCIQVFQEAGTVVWYTHLFKNFPQFVVIHSVKVFGIINEENVFLEFPCFFYDPTDLAIWSLVPLPFLNSACTSGSTWFMYYLSLAWIILSTTVLAFEISATVW